MPFISSAKSSELLTAVQKNPEILTDDVTFVTDTIDRAARYLCDAVGVKRYPELSQGESVSGASASTDISLLSDNALLVSVDGSAYYELELTLANCTSGAGTASELQTQLQAVDVGPYKFATVAFSGTQYTITSPTYGEGSSVYVSFDAEHEYVAQALQLSPTFGGTEYSGSNLLAEFDDVVIRLVTHWYNQVGVEGMRSFSLNAGGSFTSEEVDPYVMKFISNNRRIIR